MRKLLIASLFTFTALAISAPFQPKDELLISESIMFMDSAKMLVGSSLGKASQVSISGDISISNAGLVSMAAVSGDGLNQKRTARATYDVAVDLGTIAAHGLGITIPANAIIVRSWFYTVTQFVDAGAGTVAISCETANNIFSAADITGNADGVLVDGIQQAFSTFDGTGAAGILGAACELTATVATAAQSAGKLVLFVEYMVAE